MALTGLSMRQAGLLAFFAIITINIARIPGGATPGEYTDGILQLTVFDNTTGLYPPLYAMLWKVASIGFSSEVAASLISQIAFLATCALVYFQTRRFSTPRAAVLAALMYALSPLALRWSGRVMTDSLFVAINSFALWMILEARVTLRIPDAKENKALAAKQLALAVALGGLATLTRYQGVLLAPLLAILCGIYVRRFRAVPWRAVACGAIWLLVPWWMWRNGFAHQNQFAERTALSPLANFGAWWNTLESFVLISPYYFGYPLFAFAVYGAFQVKRTATPWYARPAAVLWGSYAVMLLALQAAFGSFQYRYMLPLLPIVAALAGVGFTEFSRRFAHRPWLPRWAFILTVIYLGFFSLCVIFLQSGRAFKDQREAADYIAKNVNKATPVYSNERYGNFTNLGSVKLSYWSGRPVNLLTSPDQPLEPGSVVVLGTAYGGNEAVKQWMDELSRRYSLEPLRREPFRTWLLPLMDDIMVDPRYNQNPMGWVMRYVPQEFATQIFRVAPLAGSAAGDTSGR